MKAPAPQSLESKFARRWRWRLAPVVVGTLLLTGCVGNMAPLIQQGGSLMSAMAPGAPGAPGAGAAPGAAGGAAGLAAALTAGLTPGVAADAPATLLAAGTAPLATRPPQSLASLMARGTVRGDELLGEMIAMRQALARERSTRSVALFFGSAEAAMTGAGGGGERLKGQAVDLAMNAIVAIAKDMLLSYSFRELDRHMTALVDDQSALQRETVQLPDPRGLTPQQQQRAVTLAAMVVMSRVTNGVLAKARKDFEGIESEYGQLLERREKAATVLYQALGRGSAGREELARGGLSPKDIQFLDTGLARMPLAEFSKDLGAQNLALAFLEKTDPGAFSEYRAQSQGLIGRTRGALRLTSGAAAFSAMIAIFIEQMASVARAKNGAEIVALLPLVADFTKQAVPVLKTALSAGGEGFKSAASSGKLFRVLDDTGAGVDLASAKDVFAELKKRQAEPVLRDALFRNGASGLLHKLYMCSPAEAGRLLDTAVPSGDRDKFAKAYLAVEGRGFSFANAFDTPVEQRRGKERELGDDLLRADHRERTSEGTLVFSPLQKFVAESGFQRWGEDQLMRLIFSNREGQVQHATLELGNTRLRPIASPRSVFAYESLVDQCRGLMAGDDPPPGGGKQHTRTRPRQPPGGNHAASGPDRARRVHHPAAAGQPPGGTGCRGQRPAPLIDHRPFDPTTEE
jgi:hypothetical protein